MNQHDTIPELRVLGPDCVPEWTDLYHVNDLCERCEVTFGEVDQPRGWEIHSYTAMPPADLYKTLWTDEWGPTIQEVRCAAHRGCHFCTKIISSLLVDRWNIRLGSSEKTLGWNRKVQDMLYENDRIHLVISKRGNRGTNLAGGIRIWCATGDRGATDLENNIDDVPVQSRLAGRKSIRGPGIVTKEYGHELARFMFGIADRPETYPETSEVCVPGVEDLGSGNTSGEIIFSQDLEGTRSQTPAVIPVKPKGTVRIDSELGLSSDQAQTWMDAEDIATHWLRDCLRNHECGHENAVNPVLPLRVIDVQGRENEADPFLVQTQGERARYVALSYRWGESRRLITTTENIDERCHSIPLSEMPRTFRDIVILTRRLGVQYLWIDALCILQDSTKDCLQELRSMADIYNNSTLTIAAVGSLNADDGCAPCRNKLAMCDCHVPNRRITTYGARDTLLLTSGSIHDRAWCFQETEIAPRLLSVGLDQLYWQCKMGLRRECEPAILTDPYDHKFKKGILTIQNWPIRNRFFDDTPIEDPLQAYSRWFWLIEQYGSRLLTYSTDKLPAISALAERFVDVFAKAEGRPQPGDYCCGIWRQDILPGLLWHAKKTPWRTAQPVPFRAPSWSWVASSHDVSFEFDTYPRPYACFHTTVLEVGLELVSQILPFGEVRSGKLTLFGPVAPVPEACYNQTLASASQYSKSNGSSTSRSRGEVYHRSHDAGLDESIYSDGSPDRLWEAESDLDFVGRLPTGIEDDDNFSVESSLQRVPDILDEGTSQGCNPASHHSTPVSFAISSRHRRSSSSSSAPGTQLTWITDSREGPSHVNWDSTEHATNDCRMIRITDDHAIILCPIRKPGTVGTEKGCYGGIYQRVGLINVDRVGPDYRARHPILDRSLAGIIAEFDALDWRDEVVTII